MTARRKCIFPSIFFLRMSRHFAGSKLLHIAVSLYSEYVTAGLICFLSFQAYFPPVGGKTLGAFQSRIIKRTETPYIFMYFFFFFSVTCIFLHLSSQTESLIINSSFILLAYYSSPLYLTTPQQVSGLPCSIHSLWKGFQVLKVHLRKIS